MIDMKANDNGLHLISEREEETHAKVRSEFSVPEGSIRVLFVNKFGAVQE